MKVVMPFFSVDRMLVNMAPLGYSHTGIFIIGLIDLIGGIALFIPKYRGYAIITLSLLLSGALGAHIAANSEISKIIGGACFSLVGLAILFVFDKPFSIQDKRNNINIL